MRLYRKKVKNYRQLFVIVAALLIISTIVFPTKSNANIINYPDTDYLDVSSPIVLEFDRPIVWDTSIPHYSGWSTGTIYGPNTAHHGIALTEISTGTPILVAISMQISGKKLIITPAPGPAWDKNKEYKLTITDHIVIDSSSAHVLPSYVSTSTPIVYSIGTGFLTFKDLMSGSSPEINSIIQDYTPRNIRITAPERYIQELNIIHKRQALVQNSTTESVTNLDISINDKAHENPNGDIKTLVVTPKMNGTPLQPAKILDNLNTVPNRGNHVYDFGFTRLPDTSAFDFEVILYDDNGDPLDIRIVKVPLETNTTTTIKQRDRYRFAYRTFTLYDLLNKPRDLQTLLDENRMDEIKVRVVQQ